MANAKVDWTSLHKYAPSTCWCKCVAWPGAPFNSHAKFVIDKNFKGMVSEIPCPKCGRNDSFFKVESETETFRL
jgi:hypothetical protein